MLLTFETCGRSGTHDDQDRAQDLTRMDLWTDSTKLRKITSQACEKKLDQLELGTGWDSDCFADNTADSKSKHLSPFVLCIKFILLSSLCNNSTEKAAVLQIQEELVNISRLS